MARKLTYQEYEKPNSKNIEFCYFTLSLFHIVIVIILKDKDI